MKNPFFPAVACCAFLVLDPSLRGAVQEFPIDKQPGYLKSELINPRPPYASSHAATLVETPAGLVAAWFGGVKEGAPDQAIYLSRQVDGKWTDGAAVADGSIEKPRVHALNPVLFQVPDGPLLLFFKTGPSMWGYQQRSTDGGATWSEPTRLFNGFIGPVKNKPVLVGKNVILSPSSSEIPGLKWTVHFERSPDQGNYWSFIGPVESNGIEGIQPSILIHGKNQLQAIGRTKQGYLFDTWSEDSGQTWSPLALTKLPNPNSGTDAVTLQDGRFLLIYNHATNTPGKTGGPRTPLNVAVSSDGRVWKAALVLEQGPGEFSYPAVIQTSDGLVHFAYSYRPDNNGNLAGMHGRAIKHVVVDPAKLVLRDMPDGNWPE